MENVGQCPIQVCFWFLRGAPGLGVSEGTWGRIVQLSRWAGVVFPSDVLLRGLLPKLCYCWQWSVMRQLLWRQCTHLPSQSFQVGHSKDIMRIVSKEYEVNTLYIYTYQYSRNLGPFKKINADTNVQDIHIWLIHSAWKWSRSIA